MCPRSMQTRSIMTSRNGNALRVTGPLCGESTGEFPTRRAGNADFDVFFDVSLNK